MKDNELEKTAGGYIYVEKIPAECPYSWECIKPYTEKIYHVVNGKGEFVGNGTKSLYEAKGIADANGLSTEYIGDFELASLRGTLTNGRSYINFSNNNFVQE